MKKNIAIIVLAAIAALGLTTTGAVAGIGIGKGNIGSWHIKNDTIKGKDLKPNVREKVKNGNKALNRIKRNQGAWAATSMEGTYYSVAFYDVGDTNAGAIATVACKAESDTAISGGVQVTGIEEGANSRNTPVSSSFPGRMDWDTNSPKPGRLDGWVVQFGGNAQTEGSGDKAPEKVKIWALCVPGLDVPVEQTYTQSD